MRCRYFEIRELVSKELYQARGDRCWELFNPDLLSVLDTLRHKFGPIIVNDWHAGGNYYESGLRSWGTKTGATFSMHKFGAAADCKFKNHQPQEVYDYLLAHQTEFPLLRALEDIKLTPSWLHVDVRNHDRSGIWVLS